MANTYLSRTLSGSSSREQWTFSAWVKISGNPTGSYGYLFSCTDASNHTARISIMDNNVAKFGFVDSLISTNVQTNRLLRDNNSWYHLMVVLDTTLSTASDRVKLYVNGVRETSLANTTYPSVNAGGLINYKGGSYVHNIASYNGSSNFFNGCMSHVHFADGAMLAPTVFGETDATTGEWKIKTDPTFTPGTNGFSILMNGNTITDQSANSNNWSSNGAGVTKTEDNPSNVFCTLNPLNQTNSGAVFSNGNNKMTISGQWLGINSTLFMESGKYYWEIKYGSGNYDIGIAKLGTAATQTSEISNPNHGFIGRKTGGYTLQQNGGQPYKVSANSNDGNYGSQASSGNILMVAYDADNGKLFTGINGAWNNSSNPATGANPMYTVTSTEFYCPSLSVESGSLEINFGNGYFGTTAVSSAGSNASANGIFEYDCPAGYTALSTKGLNL